MVPSVVAAVLAAAVLHATWNALAHAIPDKLVGFTLISAGYVGCAAVLVCLVPAPDPGAWPFMAGSAVLQTVYQVLLLRAYQLGDFGQMYPLARGTSPWVVAVLSVTLLGRPLPVGQLLGIVVLSLGLAVLTLADGLPGRRQLPAIAAAVGTGVVIASYTVVDGVGVGHAGSVVGYVAWEFLALGLPLPLVALALRGRALLSELRPVWWQGLLGGVMSLAAYGLVVWSQSRAPDSLAGIAALRETSIVIAAVIGVVLFHERMGRVRAFASMTVCAGIAVLELVPR